MEEAGAWGLSAAADVVGVGVCYESAGWRARGKAVVSVAVSAAIVLVFRAASVSIAQASSPKRGGAR